MNKNFTQVILSRWDKKDNENLLYSIMSLLIENKKELNAGGPDEERSWELEHREATLLKLLNELSNSLRIEVEAGCDF